jgi:hypothetical protein
MTSERSEADLNVGRLVLSPLEILAPLFGAPGVVAAIAVRLFGEGAGQWTSRQAARRLRAMVEELNAVVGDRMDQFDRRLIEVEKASDLGSRALMAAASAASDSLAQALARVLAEGVLGENEAARRAEFLVTVLSDLTEIELDALSDLAAWTPLSATDVGPSAFGVLSDGRTQNAAYANAVLARLQSRGLLELGEYGTGEFGLTFLGKELVDLMDR